MAKFIRCLDCKDIFMAINKKVRVCECGKHAAKYLSDNITAVVTKYAIVFGIDNVGFNDAETRAIVYKKVDYRRDFFFTGWIPNHPGEVIWVDTVEDVNEYPYEETQALPEGLSTNPSTD